MAKKAIKKKTTKTNQIDFSKYIKWFWMIFSGGILLIILVFLMASWGLFGEMPTFEQLENPKNNLATEIISSDDKTRPPKRPGLHAL